MSFLVYHLHSDTDRHQNGIIMFSVTLICFGLILPNLAQKLSYLPPHLYDTRLEQTDYSDHQIQGVPRWDYDTLNYVHETARKPSLSKLYKPRPAELEKLLMEFQKDYHMITPNVKSNIVPDKIAYVKQWKQLKKESSPRYGRYQFFHPLMSQHEQNRQKQAAEYNKMMYYSKIKPLEISNRYNYNKIDQGYKTEETIEEDQPLSDYEFSYAVSQPEYLLNFGHKESKQGELAKGIYYSLLPDGRTQYVEYEADQNGYKPIITYNDNQQEKYR